MGYVGSQAQRLLRWRCQRRLPPVPSSSRTCADSRADEEKKRVIQEPVQLAQAFRCARSHSIHLTDGSNFEGAQSPWEQTSPGIERTPEAFMLKPPPAPEKKDEQKK